MLFTRSYDMSGITHYLAENITDIINAAPLHARIMAVADVFDAVSQKRCYRDAMPVEECFAIIQKGRGTDFDPDIVDIFLSSKKDVIQLINENTE